MADIISRLTFSLLARNLTGPAFAGVSASLIKQTAEMRAQATEQSAAVRRGAEAQVAAARAGAEQRTLAMRQASREQIADIRQNVAGQDSAVRQSAERQVIAVREAAERRLLAVRDNLHKETAAITLAAAEQQRIINATRDKHVAGAHATAEHHGAGLRAVGGAVVGATLAAPLIVQAVSSPVKQALDFQKLVQSTTANTTMTPADTAIMTAAIKRTASTTGAPLDQLAEAFRHAVNFGFSAKDAAAMLPAAVKSALSTGSNVGDVMNTMANVMHEYNAPATDAGKFIDLLHMGAAQSNATLEEFSKVGARSIDTAANMGISGPQVIAALAGLSRHESLDDANTQIVGMLSKIINPTGSQKKELARLTLDKKRNPEGVDLLGDFSTAGLKAKGITGVMADLKKVVGDDTSELFKLVPALRGGLGAMLLTGTATKDYKTILDSLHAVLAGKITPTQKAYTEYQKTTAAQLQVTKANFQLLQIEIGTRLLPVVTRLSSTLSGALQGAMSAIAHPTGAVAAALHAIVTVGGSFLSTLGTVAQTARQLADAVGSVLKVLVPTMGGIRDGNKVLQDFGKALGGIALAVVGYRFIVGTIALATRAWAFAQVALNLAMSLNPIGLVVLAVAALALGVVYAWNHWKGFHDFIMGAWRFLSGTFGPALHTLAGIFAGVVGPALGAILHIYLTPMIITWKGLADAARDAWLLLQQLGTWLGSTFGPILGNIGNAIMSALGTSFDFVKEKIGGFLGLLHGVLDAISKLPGVGGAAKVALDALGTINDAAWGTGTAHAAGVPAQHGARLPASVTSGGTANSLHAWLINQHQKALGGIDKVTAPPPAAQGGTANSLHAWLINQHRQALSGVSAVTPQHHLSAAALAAINAVLNKPPHERSPEQNLQKDLATLMTRFRGQAGADVGDVTRMQAIIDRIKGLDDKQGALLQAQLDVARDHRDRTIAHHAAVLAQHRAVALHNAAVKASGSDVSTLSGTIRQEIAQGQFAAASGDIARFRVQDEALLRLRGVDPGRAHAQAAVQAAALQAALDKAQIKIADRSNASNLAGQLALMRDHLLAAVKQGDSAATARDRQQFILLDTQKYLQAGMAPDLAKQLALAEGAKISATSGGRQSGSGSGILHATLASLLKSEKDTTISYGASDATFFGSGGRGGENKDAEIQALKRQLANADKQLSATQQTNSLLAQQLAALRSGLGHARDTAGGIKEVAGHLARPRAGLGAHLTAQGMPW